MDYLEGMWGTRARSRVVGALLLASTLAVAPRPALADGAFPDSMALFLPSDQPMRAVLGTNFGVLVTEDGGATWRWVCEQAIASYVALYQQGPPPDHDLYAVTSDGLAISDDAACGWHISTTLASSYLVSDAFPDPNDAARVLVIGRAITPTAADSLYESTDGGRTFGDAIWAATRGTTVESVEVPKTAPDVVYLTATSTGTPKRPRVLRSNDRGRTFERFDLQATLGDRRPLIAAVDPDDADTLYLRVRRAPGEAGDRLAISRDGGRTATVAVTADAPMSGFLRAADGTLYVLTLGDSYRSTDHGMTFARWEGAPHLRALAERGGVLWAAADNFVDHFAVATSSDGGRTWVPALRFDQIAGLVDCPDVQSTCAQPWADLKQLFGITDPKPPEPPAEDCHCTSAQQVGRGVPVAWLLLGLALRTLVRRPRRRSA